MTSNILKLSTAFSLSAFLLITMFSNPVQADSVYTNDVVIDASYNQDFIEEGMKSKVIIHKCYVYKCPLEDWLLD